MRPAFAAAGAASNVSFASVDEQLRAEWRRLESLSGAQPGSQNLDMDSDPMKTSGSGRRCGDSSGRPSDDHAVQVWWQCVAQAQAQQRSYHRRIELASQPIALREPGRLVAAPCAGGGIVPSQMQHNLPLVDQLHLAIDLGRARTVTATDAGGRTSVGTSARHGTAQAHTAPMTAAGSWRQRIRSRVATQRSQNNASAAALPTRLDLGTVNRRPELAPLFLMRFGGENGTSTR